MRSLTRLRRPWAPNAPAMTAVRAKNEPIIMGRRIRPEVCGFEASTVTVDFFSGIQVHHGERSAPNAASIQAYKAVFACLTFDSGPMAKDHAQVIRAGKFKPGGIALGRAANGLFSGELKPAVLCNKTHPGEVIGYHPPAIHACEACVPPFRNVPVHQRKIFLGVLATNDLFHLPGAGQSLFNSPDVRLASMGHDEVALRSMHAQILLS